MREESILTPETIARQSSYLDWDTQPSMFKHYPHFCHRLKLSDFPSLHWLEQARCITDERSIAHKPYRRLNVPSAGNLHPIEIYVQIRDVPRMLSGIYHLDPLNRELVMIAEIAGEGIEPCVGLQQRFNGVLVMISLVPFRSSWKYGLRSWRYLYLDLGHQISALGVSVHYYGSKLTKMSVTDAKGLNRVMGMGNEEFIAAVYGVGELSQRPVRPLERSLMRVSPTDYCVPDETLCGAIGNEPIVSLIPAVFFSEAFERENRHRRSAREFHFHTICDETLKQILGIKPPKSLETVTLMLQAQSMHRGVYRHGQCIEKGDFTEDAVHLLLNQRFIAGASMVVLIYAEKFCAQTHIEAGMYAQEIYSTCERYHAGCTGIGAFYDDSALRWSDKALLYAVAIGGKKDE